MGPKRAKLKEAETALADANRKLAEKQVRRSAGPLHGAQGCQLCPLSSAHPGDPLLAYPC